MADQHQLNTMANARAALQGYKRAGFTTVDPDNPRHIELYQHLRNQMSRVYAKTFLLHLNGAKQETTAGSGWAIKYWGVPKQNFPDGLPPDLAAAEKNSRCNPRAGTGWRPKHES